VEHLRGVQFYPGQQSLEVFNGGRHAGGIQGVYQHQDGTRPPTISILGGQEGTYVPIHEIGHHASQVEGTEHSQYQTGYQRGQEEGFADQYAYEHFRDRRGERMKDLRYYPTPDNPDPTHRMNFASAYGAARSQIPVDDPLSFGRATRSPEQQAFVDAKEAESNGETLFTTWDNGDKVTFHAPSEQQWSIGEEIGHTPMGRRPQ
jgi:hypothetical protein